MTPVLITRHVVPLLTLNNETIAHFSTLKEDILRESSLNLAHVFWFSFCLGMVKLEPKVVDVPMFTENVC